MVMENKLTKTKLVFHVVTVPGEGDGSGDHPERHCCWTQSSQEGQIRIEEVAEENFGKIFFPRSFC